MSRLGEGTDGGGGYNFNPFRLVSWLGATATSLLFFISIVLAGIHLGRGMGFVDSLEATVHDYRMVAACPGELSSHWGFVNREPLVQATIKVALEWGGNPFEEICSVGFQETFQTGGETPSRDIPDITPPGGPVGSRN